MAQIALHRVAVKQDFSLSLYPLPSNSQSTKSHSLHSCSAVPPRLQRANLKSTGVQRPQPTQSTRLFVREAVGGSSGAASVEQETDTSGDESRKSRIEDAKLDVLGLVAGLDRGVAASQSDTKRVLEAVEKLEKEASLRTFQDYSSSYSPTPDSGSDGGKKFGLEAMQGVWRLVYSSGFAAGSLGGLRPGPPTGRLPILVGQVLQRVDLPSRQLDNIVELRLNVLPWPLPAVEVTASLGHSFEVLGTGTIRISFDKTTVTVGTFNEPSTMIPPISTPDLPDFLRNPARSGQFETTFLDDSFRVSRGDLGELRIFVKA